MATRLPITTENPTLAEVALAMRVNKGLERMTAADALKAARLRNVPVRESRIPRSRVGDIYLGFREILDNAGVKVGQIWASTDHRDVKNGWRQRREVTAVVYPPDTRASNAPYGIAYLHTEGSRFTGSFGVRIAKNGKIERHRLVHP